MTYFVLFSGTFQGRPPILDLIDTRMKGYGLENVYCVAFGVSITSNHDQRIEICLVWPPAITIDDIMRISALSLAT